MKILSVDKIREADAYTIKHEPVESINLMERAAKACANWIETHFVNNSKIIIFCGTGNNGGDGLAIARMLIEKNYNIETFIIRYSDKSSNDFNINFERLKKIADPKDIENTDEIPLINENDIVIDAIFGSGLAKPVTGIAADVINQVNSINVTVISIDVPSGLFCDDFRPQTTDHRPQTTNDIIIRAKYTITFQLPKYSFLFAENDKYVGRLEVLDIGLSEEYINRAEVKNYFTDADDIKKIYKPRAKHSHKGNFGHGLLISGSYGKTGAAVLASRACLRSGIGLLTTHIPKCGYNILQTAVPEAMVSIDDSENYITGFKYLSRYNAIAIGPGIGIDKETQQALKLLIQNYPYPIVFDADAINILAENKTWLSFIPGRSIFTPHIKEFERLTGKAENDFHRNELQREFSLTHNTYVVLKGAYTSITSPEGDCYFNSTGNPGMATAGSGDVLTGVILSLIAQFYKPLDACILGVYLHGLAGDKAAEQYGYEALISEDIIKNLGNAFKEI